MKKIKDCSDKEIYDEAYKNNNNSKTKLSTDNCKFCTLATGSIRAVLNVKMICL